MRYDFSGIVNVYIHQNNTVKSVIAIYEGARLLWQRPNTTQEENDDSEEINNT